jgi:hypothetical protein
MAREQRDAIAEKLRVKFAPKVATLQDRIRRAEQAVEVQKSQATGPSSRRRCRSARPFWGRSRAARW